MYWTPAQILVESNPFHFRISLLLAITNSSDYITIIINVINIFFCSGGSSDFGGGGGRSFLLKYRFC
jgi:hypothetical protein